MPGPQTKVPTSSSNKSKQAKSEQTTNPSNASLPKTSVNNTGQSGAVARTPQSTPGQDSVRPTDNEISRIHGEIEDLQLAMKSLFDYLEQQKDVKAKPSPKFKYRGKGTALPDFQKSVSKTFENVLRLVKNQIDKATQDSKTETLKKVNNKESSKEIAKIETFKEDLLTMLKNNQSRILANVKQYEQKGPSEFFFETCCVMLREIKEMEHLTTEHKCSTAENRDMKAFLLEISKVKSSNGGSGFDLNITKQQIRKQFRSDEEFRSYVMRASGQTSKYIHNLVEDKQQEVQKFELPAHSDDKDLAEFDKGMIDMINSVKQIKHNKRMVVKDLEESNEALNLRLSKLAGSRLTDSNPGITNLGDPNRPMKIGEMYTELYDNDWTDSLESLTTVKKIDESIVLQSLHSTVMCCYKFCCEKAKEKFDEFLKSTKQVIKVDNHEDEVKSMARGLLKVTVEKQSEDIFKNVKDKKDQTFPKLVKEMKIDINTFKNIFQTPYFEKCFKLCWKMAVQDPPLVLLDGPGNGAKFDRNIFREYTSSGTNVVFTIWPPLLLHQGGPVLIKGVVKVK